MLQLQAFLSFIGENQMMACLVMMAVRLRLVRRALLGVAPLNGLVF
ncbi:MAG: hypothetical protein ABIO36_08515 [Pyrinomonadaceae bacterium]